MTRRTVTRNQLIAASFSAITGQLKLQDSINVVVYFTEIGIGRHSTYLQQYISPFYTAVFSRTFSWTYTYDLRTILALNSSNKTVHKMKQGLAVWTNPEQYCFQARWDEVWVMASTESLVHGWLKITLRTSWELWGEHSTRHCLRHCTTAESSRRSPSKSPNCTRCCTARSANALPTFSGNLDITFYLGINRIPGL